MIYLDAAATTPVRREVLEAMWPYLTGEFGNPASHHELGARALDGLDDARARVASVLGCSPSEVVFTSGGTESDNLAIKGLVLPMVGQALNAGGSGAVDAGAGQVHVAVSAIEHSAVLESARYLERWHGVDVSVLPVDSSGVVSADALESRLVSWGGKGLVSIMYANNEVGTVQDIAALSAIAHQHGALFHTDAVQAAGWLPLKVSELGVDALSISGHKLGAPKGCGVLYVSRSAQIEPVMSGGGQERGLRSGTVSVANAVAMATALELAESERLSRVSDMIAMRDRFISRVRELVPSVVLTGLEPAEGNRLPNNVSFIFSGFNGESVLLELERRGVICSSGSACAAGSTDPSHVLIALGISEDDARTVVRFTLPSTITSEDLERAANLLSESIAHLANLRQK
ncbi:cysteine desulfurase [Neomicrococcus aestuarii]|uniref:cysteine desulfurase n=1 Tax=Neomicrococcus aestuarii TaxID=556325 RepID=A0A7W8TVK3_9MICC|nr:cysteine desulfurase family protein [Neomicrococcus aestuarii]MBB5512905.1 cysteine desulfurase [Neomicrococcus aestuarii]